MSDDKGGDLSRPWLELELEDDLDEEREQEIDDRRLPTELHTLFARRTKNTIDRQRYFDELIRLQSELVKLQDWVTYKGLKVVVLCPPSAPMRQDWGID